MPLHAQPDPSRTKDNEKKLTDHCKVMTSTILCTDSCIVLALPYCALDFIWKIFVC